MTPEREKEIREIAYSREYDLGCARPALFDMITAYDKKTAETDTLRTQLESLRTAAEKVADRDYTWIEGMTAVEFKPMQELRQALALTTAIAAAKEGI